MSGKAVGRPWRGILWETALDDSFFQDQVVYVTVFSEHKPSCEVGGVIFCFRSAKWFLEDQDGEG